MPNDSVKLLEQAYETGKVVFVGMGAGVAQTLYSIKKGEKTNWTMFFVNMFLAGFVAILLDEVIPDSSMKTFIIGMMSFGAYPFLNTIYSIIPSIVREALRTNRKD